MNFIKGNFISAPTCGKLLLNENSYMALENGCITGIYDVLPGEYANALVEDFGGCLILQSFSDLHLHAPQYPMLGLGMDLPLLQWLKKYAFPTEEIFRDSAVAREIYARLADRLIHAGTTRVSVFGSLHTDATLILMEEFEKAGITGFAGKVNMDRNGMPGVYEEETEESVRETYRFLEGAAKYSRMKPILTPRFTPACSDTLMKELGKIAAETGLCVQSHLSENKNEIAWVRELCPGCGQYWESYDRAGLWKSGTLMAHCVWSDTRERKAMHDAGVSAVHCPTSNINIMSGFSPLTTLLKEGNRVVLGSDIAGGDSIEMNRVIVSAVKTSKARRIEDEGEPFLSVAEGYYLGTSAGAEYFGSAPGFAVGEPLHAIAVDESSFPPAAGLGLSERLERALYLMSPADIRAVWSAGRRAV